MVAAFGDHSQDLPAPPRSLSFAVVRLACGLPVIATVPPPRRSRHAGLNAPWRPSSHPGWASRSRWCAEPCTPTPIRSSSLLYGRGASGSFSRSHSPAFTDTTFAKGFATYRRTSIHAIEPAGAIAGGTLLVSLIDRDVADALGDSSLQARPALQRQAGNPRHYQEKSAFTAAALNRNPYRFGLRR